MSANINGTKVVLQIIMQGQLHAGRIPFADYNLTINNNNNNGQRCVGDETNFWFCYVDGITCFSSCTV